MAPGTCSQNRSNGTHACRVEAVSSPSGNMAGWSGASDSPIHSASKAILRRTSAADTPAERYWRGIIGKHFVHGLTCWVLKSAEAINNSRPTGSGHVVGTGLLNGSPRAFVLVPNSIP
jgi:hypothetical protein